MKPYIVLAFIFVFLFSCSSPKNQHSESAELFNAIIKTEQGLFRGIDMGHSVDEARKSEELPPLEWDSDFLYYEIALDTFNSYSITYEFENGLNEIQVNVFIKDDELFESLMENFKSHYNNKYKAVQQEREFWIWTVNDSKNNIKIALADESAETEFRKLSLSFYNSTY